MQRVQDAHDGENERGDVVDAPMAGPGALAVGRHEEDKEADAQVEEALASLRVTRQWVAV